MPSSFQLDVLNETANMKKLVFGINTDGNCNGVSSIHAESMALSKLVTNPRIKLNKWFDIFVFRLSKSRKIGESRPCKRCICHMIESDARIRNVYYTTADGNIECERLNNMLDSPKTYITSGDRKDRWNKKVLKKRPSSK
jgi:cytidine deaminase